MDGNEYKACPFCKEQIRATAIKCRFCGEWLESKPEQKPADAPQARDEKPVEVEPPRPANVSVDDKETITIEEPKAAYESSSPPPPIPQKEAPKKRSWELTPKRLNWISAGLLAFCLVTVIVGLWGANFNDKAVEKLTEGIMRILICAGIFAWMARKAGKGYALFAFSLVCAVCVVIGAYYFQVGRQTAKQRNRQWAENSLDFYTNALDFMERGGTGSVPSVKLTGDAVNDAASQMMRALVASIASTTGRMNEEIDSLGKRDVFRDSVLESRQILQQELKKRTDALAVLEKYRSALASIKEECKTSIVAPGLMEADRQAMIRGMENSFQTLSPKWDSVINARASVETADRDFLQFLSGAFDDYRLKDGKIQFGNNTNIANYKALSKAITDANAELESMVKRFLSEGEAGKQKIRSLGGLDPSKH